MTAKRFMVDDAGTLIDMQTRDMFDIVEEVVDLLNELHEKNEQLRIEKNTIQKQHFYELTKKLEYKLKLIDARKENEQLKSFIKLLASPDNRIWLANGYGYRIDKILKGDVND